MPPAKGAFSCDHRLSLPPLHPTPLGCPVGQPRDRDGIHTLCACSGNQEALTPRFGSPYNLCPVACAGKEKASQDVKLPVLRGMDPICGQ